jgi:hypothetical protein
VEVLVPYTGHVSLFCGKWRELVDIFMAELCDLSEKESKEMGDHIFITLTAHAIPQGRTKQTASAYIVDL